MPQVRILSPRCDNKSVPSWCLNRPARGGFFIGLEQLRRICAKSRQLRRVAGLKNPAIADGADDFLRLEYSASLKSNKNQRPSEAQSV